MRLTAFPSSTLNGLLQLETLNASGLELHSFGPILDYHLLTKLTMLDLSHNRLTALPCKALASLPNLSLLNLSHNLITDLSSVCNLSQLTLLETGCKRF
jgi:Leucine-rich repeat (LRR) protein